MWGSDRPTHRRAAGTKKGGFVVRLPKQPGSVSFPCEHIVLHTCLVKTHGLSIGIAKNLVPYW